MSFTPTKCHGSLARLLTISDRFVLQHFIHIISDAEPTSRIWDPAYTLLVPSRPFGEVRKPFLRLPILHRRRCRAIHSDTVTKQISFTIFRSWPPVEFSVRFSCSSPMVSVHGHCIKPPPLPALRSTHTNQSLPGHVVQIVAVDIRSRRKFMFATILHDIILWRNGRGRGRGWRWRRLILSLRRAFYTSLLRGGLVMLSRLMVRLLGCDRFDG